MPAYGREVPDRFVGVWLLERTESGDVVHPHGVLFLTPDGWFSMQTGGGRACAGHFGIDGERFMLDPVVALSPDEVGQVQSWHWSFDGDVLVLASADARLRWHRESADVVTGLGTD